LFILAGEAEHIARVNRKPVVDRKSLLIACTIAVVLAGCVANKPYRLRGIADEFYPNQAAPSERNTAGSDRAYQLSFIEFDERGDFWDRRQLGRAGEAIAKHKSKPVLLVMFIHGWHNNADENNPSGDVQTFRCLLSQLAVSDSTRDVDVHGVYLGWRGRLLAGHLDYFTFWGRKGAATRVAGTPVTETIFELIRQARKYHPGKAKCVLVGHSFGALVLEKAMAQAMTGSILSQDTQAGGGEFNAPADLVLLVNSAGESIYAKEMRDMFERIQHRGDVNAARPLMISITSESDTATSQWFRIGTFLPNLFAHRQYHWDTRYDHASAEVDQNEYLTTTPGHNPRLFSHQVLPAASPADAPAQDKIAQREKPADACSEPNPAFEENLSHPHGLIFATGDHTDPHTFKWWQLEKAGPDPTTPYWIMHVPDEIIHGHGPIFTPNGRAMMAALFRITNPPQQEGPRQMRLQTEVRPRSQTALASAGQAP
jgi:pimeloyl-ACP methyl ester carboxylesterase